MRSARWRSSRKSSRRSRRRVTCRSCTPGPVAPHWEIHRVFGDQHAIDEFRQRAMARLQLLAGVRPAVPSQPRARRPRCGTRAPHSRVGSRRRARVVSRQRSSAKRDATMRAITVQHEHDHDQGERRAPRPVVRGRERRLRVEPDLLRQRRVRAVERVGVDLGRDADREQAAARSRPRRARRRASRRSRCRAARPAATIDMTVRQRRAPSASLAWRRSFGTSFSISSRRPDDDRQHQARQRQRARESRVAGVQPGAHPDRRDEETHHDRRHAGHHVGHEPDHLRGRLCAAVLVQVDRGEHAERDRQSARRRR